MPMLFAPQVQTIRAGGRPQIPGVRGSYQRYRSPSFPPASSYPRGGVAGNYERVSAISFPPATPVPGGRISSHPGSVTVAPAAGRATPVAGVAGGFQRTMWNAPPYFSAMGDGSVDIFTQAKDWVTDNPLLAAGGAAVLGALVFSTSGRRRRR